MKRLVSGFFFLILSNLSFAQWQEIYHDLSMGAGQVTALNKDTVFIVSYWNQLMKTTDGGTNWDTIFFANSQIVKSHFIDQSNGFVAGSASFITGPTFFKTSDCGINWTPMNFSAGAPYFKADVFFLDKDTGFVTDGNEIGKTTDGGLTFQTIWLDTTNAVHDIHFINRTTGFAATIFSMPWSFAYTENRIYKTTDQGATWTLVHNDNDMGNNSFVFAGIVEVFFVDDTFGVAVGGEGKILKTTDGGDTWVNVPNSFNDYDITDVQFLSTTSGYISYAGKIYFTNDGMQTWELQEDSSKPYDIYYLAMVDAQLGYGAGHGIFKTTNGGVTSVENVIGEHVSLNVYPNPAQHIIYVDYERNLKVQAVFVTDHTGRIVRRYEPSDHVLDVSGFANGVYYLTLRTNAGIVSKKIIIKW